MAPAPALATAATFVWLGMVVAISFLEAPLKFRAPGMTPRIGLGIGRLVFRALNVAEAGLAAVLVVALVLARPGLVISIASAIAVGTLAVQVLAVRPRLSRRSAAVLAGADLPRSRGHLVYVALEVVKVLALVATGVWLLAG
jgi:hypothetical protein